MAKRERLPFRLEIPYRRKRKDVVGKVLPLFPPEEPNLFRFGSGKVKSIKEARRIKRILQARFPNKKVEVRYYPEEKFVRVWVYNKKSKRG